MTISSVLFWRLALDLKCILPGEVIYFVQVVLFSLLHKWLLSMYTPNNLPFFKQGLHLAIITFWCNANRSLFSAGIVTTSRLTLQCCGTNAFLTEWTVSWVFAMLLLHKNNINVYLACNFVCMTNIVSYVFVISMSNTCIADHDLDTLVALNPCYIYLFFFPHGLVCTHNQIRLR